MTTHELDAFIGRAKALHSGLEELIGDLEIKKLGGRVNAAALEMLLSGMSRPDIKEALIARFGISRPTAYRALARALDLRRKQDARKRA